MSDFRVERSQTPLVWPAYHDEEAPVSKAKERVIGAEEQVASLYYATTLLSLKVSQEADQAEAGKTNTTTSKKDNSSLLGKISDWFFNLIGLNIPEAKKEQTEIQTIEKESVSSPINSLAIPTLASPEIQANSKLQQKIADLHLHLATRLKDMAEFEEEMRRSPSNDMDRLIMTHLVATSLKHKELHEEAGLHAMTSLMEKQDENKELKKSHSTTRKEIKETAQQSDYLKWANYGTTGCIVAGMAAGFALGGLPVVLASILPILGAVRGVTGFAKSLLDHKNNVKSGELFMTGQRIRMNSDDMQTQVGSMQEIGESIGEVHKALRMNIDHHGKAVRANFGRAGGG